MRPLEIVLQAANLGVFMVLLLPLRGRARQLRYAAVALPVVATAQVLVEGPRWQMTPAYVLAGLLCVVSVIGGRRSGSARWRRVAAGLGIGLAVLGLAVAVALPTVLPVFRFPPPTGSYGIGTMSYHWVDADRGEVFTADPQDRRELMAQIWYPATPAPAAPRSPYIDDTDEVAPAVAGIARLPRFALGHLMYVTSHAVVSAPVADGERGYPVLIFLEGLGGYRQVNTFQVEELVSHGYVVVALDQPYTAAAVVFPDGRTVAYDSRMDPPHRWPNYDPDTAPAHSAFSDAQLPFLADDVSFALDRVAEVNRADPNGILTGRLDLDRVGLFGQSLGGIVGGVACLREPRLQACLLEDAYMTADVVDAGLTQPTMWITRDAATMRLERETSGGWGEAAIREHLSTMRAVYESLAADGYYVQVPGMFHVEMTDAPLVTPLARQFGLAGPIGPQRVHEIINAYSVAFFDRHLNGEPAPLLDGPSSRYPEVSLEARRWREPALGRREVGVL